MSDILFMSHAGGGGLPPSLRHGLVVWYDPYRQVQTTGEAKTLTDYSGAGNHATLGATSEASTDDPAWTGNSLEFTTDDFVVSDVIPGLNMGGAWTLMMAKKFPTGNIDGNLLSLGNPASSAYGMQIRSGKIYRSMDWNSDPVDGIFYSASSEILAVCSDGSSITGENLTDGTTITGSNPLPDKPTRIGIGVYARLAMDVKVVRTSVYGFLAWNRCLSQAERHQAGAYLKRILNGRGVTI